MNARTTPTHNAAALLAVLLSEWLVPPNRRPEQVRGFEGPDDLDSWRTHTHAADLIRRVDYTIQGMDAAGEDVEMFLLALPRWYSGVHFAATPWGTTIGSPREACDQRDIDLLRALGALIKAGGPIAIDEDHKRTLADVLTQARELVEADTTMTPDVRHYIWGLILRAQMVVDNLERYGPEAVREVALELGGAMTSQADMAASRGDAEKAGRWRSGAAMLLGGFMSGAASTGGTQALTAAEHVIKQLGN
jgi:hypothetical protein